jgi:hypothetical protein
VIRRGMKQGRDPQAAIGLDTDHDLARLRRVLGQQRVQLRDPGKPLRQPSLREPQADVWSASCEGSQMVEGSD